MTHLVLYDGVCGLCDRFVQFLIRIDRHDRLRFAALQGEIGAKVLAGTGRTANALSTVLVMADHGSPDQRLLERSDAAIFAIAACGGAFTAVRAFRIVPRFIRDAAYDLLAKHRYRIFGSYDSCPVPTPRTRTKFLDAAPRVAAR